MEIRQYGCQGCSKSCSIQVELEQGRVTGVTGHGCQKGKDMVLDFVLMD
ncbi:MAG TPA: hypothetical protein GXX34_04300 [Clostridia bacterium]|nr:hypothetical protein [Clostridia bacterium]